MIYNIKQNEFSMDQFLPISFWQMRSTDQLKCSRLLLAMQEKQVTIGDTTLNWQTFLSIGNSKSNWTRRNLPAPEAQVDRFMLKTVIDYLKWMKSAWLFVKTWREAMRR
jgi:hypothetical protein